MGIAASSSSSSMQPLTLPEDSIFLKAFACFPFIGTAYSKGVCESLQQKIGYPSVNSEKSYAEKQIQVIKLRDEYKITAIISHGITTSFLLAGIVLIIAGVALKYFAGIFMIYSAIRIIANFEDISKHVSDITHNREVVCQWLQTNYSIQDVR
jgi:hypothetical protein